jgi:pectate lyase
VFRVGGVFVLTRGSLLINRPFLTLAGQTAPGGGVLITHDGGSAARTPVLIKNTTDVVIRHVRSRPIQGPVPTANSAFTIEGSQRVIIDHASASWAEDENVTVHAGTTDLTVSWSILAEGLLPHSKCALLNSNPTGPQRITFARNLCASNNDRNPDLHSQPNSCVDVINNVFYNVNSGFTEIWGNFGGTWANIAGNVYRRGPETNFMMYALIWRGAGATGTPRIYEYGNLADGSRITIVDPALQPYLVTKPVCVLSTGRDTAAKIYTQVLDRAGAFPRDAVDSRIVGEVVSRTGSRKSAPGAMPPIADEPPYADVDGDGMSDAWESQNGLNPALFDAWSRRDEKGFYALDRFLDHAHLQRLVGGSVP